MKNLEKIVKKASTLGAAAALALTMTFSGPSAAKAEGYETVFEQTPITAEIPQLMSITNIINKTNYCPITQVVPVEKVTTNYVTQVVPVVEAKTNVFNKEVVVLRTNYVTQNIPVVTPIVATHDVYKTNVFTREEVIPIKIQTNVKTEYKEVASQPYFNMGNHDATFDPGKTRIMVGPIECQADPSIKDANKLRKKVHALKFTKLENSGYQMVPDSEFQDLYKSDPTLFIEEFINCRECDDSYLSLSKIQLFPTADGKFVRYNLTELLISKPDADSANVYSRGNVKVQTRTFSGVLDSKFSDRRVQGIANKVCENYYDVVPSPVIDKLSPNVDWTAVFEGWYGPDEEQTQSSNAQQKTEEQQNKMVEPRRDW